jgi:hypothetical protein
MQEHSLLRMECLQNAVHKLLFKLDGNCSGVGHAGTHSLLFSGSDNLVCEIAAARASTRSYSLLLGYQALVVLDEADSANAH